MRAMVLPAFTATAVCSQVGDGRATGTAQRVQALEPMIANARSKSKYV